MAGKVKRKRVSGSNGEDLSIIEDREVKGYLNNKEEANYKKILWEAMYGNYSKPKKQKRRTTRKKEDIAVKKDAVRAKEVVEPKKKSSRINYDVVKTLVGELDQDCETAQTVKTDTARTEEGSNGNSYYQNAEDEEWFNDFDSPNYDKGGDHEICYDDDEYYDF